MHLLGTEDLSREEIGAILDLARDLAPRALEGTKKRSDLAGRTVANLFFEPSTRTKTSFALAARRLGADVVDYSVGAGSTVKGETTVDTARNIEAMGVSQVVVRHATVGSPHLLSRRLDARVLNAGDGTHEHPTQALLDIFTIREHRGTLKGLTVTLVGDILHSRVARSNIWGLQKLGAEVYAVGPPTLVPRGLSKLGVKVSHHLDEIVREIDVFNMLRIQTERQDRGLFPTIREYQRLFGLNRQRLENAKPEALVLHPGPINRGVELTPDVADGPQSVILNQVANGLAVRMAVLYLVGERPAIAAASASLADE